MAVYRICKVRKSTVHGRITQVTCREDLGQKLGKKEIHTVEGVRSMMENKDRFYTFGLTSLKSAGVDPDTVRHGGETIETIRSGPDRLPENNLENLPIF